MPGDGYTEAEAAWAYLTDAGVPAEAIMTENAASDTWESMQGIAVLLQPQGIDQVIVVSDGFHLFRSRMMARDVGLQAWGSPAEMSPIRTGGGGELTYVMREAAAVVAHLWQSRGARHDYRRAVDCAALAELDPAPGRRLARCAGDGPAPGPLGAADDDDLP